MRAVYMIIAALGLFGIGVFTGLHLLSPEPPIRRDLFTDRALAHAVIEAGAVELAESDCFLGQPPDEPVTVADFLIPYSGSLTLAKDSSGAECGGRGVGKCSVAFSTGKGDQVNTSILLFSRDGDGKLMTEDITCITL